MTERAMQGLGFKPTDDGPAVTELRERFKDSPNAHADWTDAGRGMAAEERAKILLDVDWQIARGHSASDPPLDPMFQRDFRTGKIVRPWAAFWEYVGQHRGYPSRAAVAWARRTWDITIMRRDPYGIRKNR